MDKLCKWLLVLCSCLALVACSKITQENFDEIQSGMSMKEVIAILGEPVSVESTNFAGMSGATAKWKSTNVEVDVLFFNDKVQYKNFAKSKFWQR